ncbi:hypothetical protein BsIDN1_62380 [Bacillus safensis]|uniref:Uncharacterized protein n=1 Tax=Bacillus safensis TaxID=561879 RepID=A0A5S9MGK3_BACIA|nr:hypothetical protein BsIDN1_62380 [Bacillus safensis]
MIEAIKNKFDLLVWAVCGAGKTEVLFHGIEYALNQGMSVCIATPRTDVVLELEPRLRKAFQGVIITVLFGRQFSKVSNSTACDHHNPPADEIQKCF